jgi:hypothetical protein
VKNRKAVAQLRRSLFNNQHFHFIDGLFGVKGVIQRENHLQRHKSVRRVVALPQFGKAAKPSLYLSDDFFQHPSFSILIPCFAVISL